MAEPPRCPQCHSPRVKVTGMMVREGGLSVRDGERPVLMERDTGQVPMLCKDCGHAWAATVPYSAPAGESWNSQR